MTLLEELKTKEKELLTKETLTEHEKEEIEIIKHTIEEIETY